jgi:hypothetical protein
MPVPSDFDATRHGPLAVTCSHCRQGVLSVTPAYRLTQTGVVDHLHLCPYCGWGIVLRYDPAEPTKYIVLQWLSPGQSKFSFVIPRKGRGKKWK